MGRGLPLLHLVTRSHPTRGRCFGWKSGDQGSLYVTGKSFIINFLPFVFCRPGYSPSVGQEEWVQHIGSQTQLGSGIPMVPVRAEQKRNAHELMGNVIYLHCMSKSFWRRRFHLQPTISIVLLKDKMQNDSSLCCFNAVFRLNARLNRPK